MLFNCGVGEDSESPLDCKEIKPVHPKRNQPWIFIGKTDAEAEAPIPWPPDVKSQLIRKDPDAGKDWGQEEKGETEDEMVRQHHWLNDSEQTLGNSEGQGSLVCCSSQGFKESDTTEQLNSKMKTEEHLQVLCLTVQTLKETGVWRIVMDVVWKTLGRLWRKENAWSDPKEG